MKGPGLVNLLVFLSFVCCREGGLSSGMPLSGGLGWMGPDFSGSGRAPVCRRHGPDPVGLWGRPLSGFEPGGDQTEEVLPGTGR